MPALPIGTVTFLFTDIEGSTRLWETYPEAMRSALARHDALMRTAIEANNGHVFKTIGDAFCAAFHTAPDALNAALSTQQTLHSEPWPVPLRLKVRMALHTGAVEHRDHDYFGPPLNRVARLLAAGYGGQVLVSLVTQELVRDALPPSCSIVGLGEHRLRDLTRSEVVFQLVHPTLPSEFPPLRSLDNPEMPNNLPQQLTSFIGREQTIEEVMTLLGKTRLLTLTGSGGCGKTRLALQVTADALEQFPEGVWLVELAPLADPTLVIQTVAQVLGVKEQTGETFQQTLIERLKSRRLLLVLDNCEHLTASCARWTGALLRSCPQVKVMATSREPLGVAGELTYRVPSLSFPDPKQTFTPESLSQYEAVRLFIARAHFHKPGFMVTHQNAPALAQLCHRLDGIPLALELAAARVRSLSVEDINAKMDGRFRLLTGGDRTALPRQQTLRAAIDWSYNLLNTEEKLLLARLSVFAGGWTLEAAVQVGSGEGEAVANIEEWEVLDFLTSLVDKSLVLAEEQYGTTRYRILETLRQYATEKLKESGETEQIKTRHRDYFLALAEKGRPQFTGSEQEVWLERLEAEHDNLRAALICCEAQTEGAEAGLRLAGALWLFWERRCHFSEGREQLGLVLRREEGQTRTSARAWALHGAGILAYRQGDYRAARALGEASLVINKDQGDRWGTANALHSLGGAAYYEGDYEAAQALLEESLSIRRELDDRHGIAEALGNLGTVAKDQGDYSVARVLYKESLNIYRELGDRISIAAVLDSLGFVAYIQSEYETARALYEESLSIARVMDNRWCIAWVLSNLGALAQDEGDASGAWTLLKESLTFLKELGDRRGVAHSLESMAVVLLGRKEVQRAVCLWGAAYKLRETIGSPLPPNLRAKHADQVAQARAALSKDSFAAAWEEGQAMTWKQAVEYALKEE